jgi:predicted nuclease with TOPRIM domain
MKDYIHKMEELMSQIEDLENELRADVYNAINEVASENKRQKISRHIFIVKFSELKTSWEPSYYDWEASADILINKLERKGAKTLVPYLRGLYENRNKNGVSIIKYRAYTNFANFTLYEDVTHTVNSEFIRQILVKLEVL